MANDAETGACSGAPVSSRALSPLGGIRVFIRGEEWGLFDEDARGLCERFPDLREDTDYNRENPGITIVEL